MYESRNEYLQVDFDLTQPEFFNLMEQFTDFIIFLIFFCNIIPYFHQEKKSFESSRPAKSAVNTLSFKLRFFQYLFTFITFQGRKLTWISEKKLHVSNNAVALMHPQCARDVYQETNSPDWLQKKKVCSGQKTSLQAKDLQLRRSSLVITYEHSCAIENSLAVSSHLVYICD